MRKKLLLHTVASFNGKNGYQVAFMAPTEILAKQHLKAAKNLFSKFGIQLNF